MDAASRIELDGQYRALREEAGFLGRQRGVALVKGPDAAEFLQGQLTNDLDAVGEDEGCYAALLDRKGHMQADMRVLRLSTGDIWLDTEPEAIGGRRATPADVQRRPRGGDRPRPRTPGRSPR